MDFNDNPTERDKSDRNNELLTKILIKAMIVEGITQVARTNKK